MENDRSDEVNPDSLVHEYVENYEFRGDGDYTPNEGECVLIEDAIHGFIAELGQLGLIVHPPRAENAQVAEPVGWVLVPREPTGAMVQAGARRVSYESPQMARNCFEAMLAASPPAQQAEVTGLEVDDLAQIIRRVDGDNSLGAGALAEAIVAALSIGESGR